MPLSPEAAEAHARKERQAHALARLQENGDWRVLVEIVGDRIDRIRAEIENLDTPDQLRRDRLVELKTLRRFVELPEVARRDHEDELRRAEAARKAEERPE